MAVDVSRWYSAQSNGGYEEFWLFHEAKDCELRGNWLIRLSHKMGVKTLFLCVSWQYLYDSTYM